jgi:alpha-glucosidase
VRIRKDSDALANGGLRWIEVDDDSILFVRESKRQKLLVFISRTGVKKTIDLAPLGVKVERTLFGSSAKGKKISISSDQATQGVWLVK